MIARVAAGLAALMVAACGDIPQPFRHDGSPPDLARPKLVRGVTIRPLAGYEAAGPLAAAMVKAMEDREIAAIVRDGPAFGPVVEGRAVEDGVVEWRLLGPDGTEAALHRQRLPAGADPARLKRLAADAVAALALPLSTDPDALPRRDIATGPRPTVRLVPLAGLPGDGDKTLNAALKKALDRAGLILAEDGEYLVQGSVLLSPVSATEENLALNWVVRRARDNMMLASIDQGGAVPRGRLSVAWGGLARDIAEGGAAGIFEVVQAARRKTSSGLTLPPEATLAGPTQFTEPRPTDIREPDPREHKDEARNAAEPAVENAPPPPEASPTKPAKATVKASAGKAGANGGRAKGKPVAVKPSRVKRPQR